MASSHMLEVVKRAARAEDITAALARADVRELASREVAVIGRRIGRLGQDADLRIAYLGSHTIEPLPQYVAVAAATQGIQLAAYVGDFNQYYQEVLGASPGLGAFDPQVIVLFLSLRELAPQVDVGFSKLDQAGRQAEFDAIIGHVTEWAELALKGTSASILIAGFVTPSRRRAGIADLQDGGGEAAFVMRLNLELMSRFAGNPRVHLFDTDGVLARYGKIRAFSPTMYNLARMPWHEGVLPHLADELLRYLYAHLGRTKKCLVLDLDNTLWGGVLGEDGPDGIEVGPGSAAGEAFLAFQHAVVGLKDRGVMLAINSKNNDEDVREAFRSRSDMPLKLEDFSALRINWQNKSDNLVAIAAELNIGIDSLVFVDDNPAECALIEEMLPDVLVVRLPADPADYADLLQDLVAFEKLGITDEDRAKASQYQQQRQRAQHRDAVGDIESYLASLETSIRIRPATEANQMRIHQMFAKTNQFNLTTKRYSPADIERFTTDANFVLRTIDATDRFGALGIIGLYLVDLSEGLPRIDSFLMSCRAIGRGIETAVMNTIKEEILLEQGHEALFMDFVPTRKNVPARSFCQAQGFTKVAEAASGHQSYRIEAGEVQLVECPHVTIV